MEGARIEQNTKWSSCHLRKTICLERWLIVTVTDRLVTNNRKRAANELIGLTAWWDAGALPVANLSHVYWHYGRLVRTKLTSFIMNDVLMTHHMCGFFYLLNRRPTGFTSIRGCSSFWIRLSYEFILGDGNPTLVLCFAETTQRAWPRNETTYMLIPISLLLILNDVLSSCTITLQNILSLH